MTAIWVVQNCKDRQFGKIISALDATKSPYIVANTKYEGGLTVPDRALGTKFIPYGSTTLIKLADALSWDYLFYNDNFNVTTYNARHQYMLNPDSMVVSLEAAKQLADFRDKWFVRPNDDTKEFAGHVCSNTELKQWISQLEDIFEYTDIRQLALSSVKEIQMEWRHFIVGENIITSSIYRCNGESLQEAEKDEAVLREAQLLAKHWMPHPCCVMDVALCGDRPYVIEFNTLNASGFYDHDVEALVTAVNEVASRY